MCKMKALTISEFINKDYDSKLELMEYLHIPILYDSDIDEEINSLVFQYNNFLSQPFCPELIEQLFDGCLINILSQYANNDCRIDIHKNHIEYNNGYKLFYFIIPTTLNDFISDCQRAGIELIFKEVK